MILHARAVRTATRKNCLVCSCIQADNDHPTINMIGIYKSRQEHIIKKRREEERVTPVVAVVGQQNLPLVLYK